MQKDFKIGMILGLVLVTAFALWLSTRPSLSIKARALNPRSAIGGNPTKQAKSLVVIDRLSPSDELKLPEFSANKQPEEDPHFAGTQIKTERFHIVRRGETLSDISYRYYGSADKWQKILDANRFPVKNPNRLRPGTKLIIPE